MWNDILKNPDKLRKITESAFSAIDFNNNGRIEKSELESVMLSTAEDLGIEKPSKEEIKDVLKELDSNSKGYLSKYPNIIYTI